jgi:hypothetical protein
VLAKKNGYVVNWALFAQQTQKNQVKKKNIQSCMGTKKKKLLSPKDVGRTYRKTSKNV